MTLKSDAEFEEKPICCFKNDKNLVNFDRSTQMSKIFTLIGLFHAKYITFDLKKHRGVILHDTEELCKIWRKTDHKSGKWHEGFGKFLSEHSKVSKLGLCCDPFIQRRKYMSLWGSQRILTQVLKNLKNLHFNGLLLTKVYNVWAKKV